MWRTECSRRLVGCLCRKPGLVLVLLPCLVFVTLYVVSEEGYDFDVQYPSFRFYNGVVEGSVEGYLVWSTECHMPSKDPFDRSIASLLKKEKYESCSNEPAFTQLSREPNGSVVMFVDPAAAALHPNLECCWSEVVRPKVNRPKKTNFDSTIVLKPCEVFKNQVILPWHVQVVLVKCKADKGKSRSKQLYENVHPVLNVDKARDLSEYNASLLESVLSRKLSVLVLGVDSVSRLNFLRSMPKTEKYLRGNDWIGFKGYNKMGDNTFPNLMAILTGQNVEQAYTRCKPTVAYKLDRCPFLWQNFRNAGYATAYGEDETSLNTFNYLKVGFVDPPTDYYLRPYMLASEKLLRTKKRFGLKYCTGPEASFQRIFNYASSFAQAFLGQPYFGFFWTTSVSHENMNGVSSIDGWFHRKLEYMEREGIFNDSMVIFLSDHGMRWGAIRNTFIGWYEERLPFLYISLPHWFRTEYPEAERSLRINQNRLTSPFDIYETLRDVLRMSGSTGSVDATAATAAEGCPKCQTLFEAVPRDRACHEAGVAPHWCTCTAFKPADTADPGVLNGVTKFLAHLETVIAPYKDKQGKRLCAKLKLKKLHRVDRVIDFGNSGSVVYFYMVQLTPGDGKFEFSIRHHGQDNYTLSDDQVSRINPYASSAKCLNHGMKQYCHCLI